MTGRINFLPAAHIPPPVLPTCLQIQTVTVPCEEGRKDKELQGAKAFWNNQRSIRVLPSNYHALLPCPELWAPEGPWLS